MQPDLMRAAYSFRGQAGEVYPDRNGKLLDPDPSAHERGPSL